MLEFFNTVFSPANVISSGLLMLVVVYWITVMLGAVDLDFLDFDIDIDGDVDMDADVDQGGLLWLNHILTFFNLGKIPFMVWLSFLSLPLWLLHVNANNLLGIESFLFGLITFLPALIVGLFIAKFATWPFVGLFNKLEEGTKEKVILGKVGTVIINATHDSRGQAEVESAGSYLMLYIVTRKGVEVKKGDKVLFIQEIEGTDDYLIEPYFD
ncbi:OB-fold-containig protein [Sanyastnella coralliicola]|uniref:OB-fold-containig protein n=1 Tax=Sanyastnella coralliicola TaxID=3069118 RepID=UPI0027B8D883|nr:OB-fold-containig protein [Longitalea sp. SCSIO 12813]